MGTDIQILSYLVQQPDEFEILEPMFRQSEFSFENKGVELLRQCLTRNWEKANRFPTLAQCKEQLSRIRGVDAEKKAIIYELADQVYTGTWDDMDKEIILGRILQPQVDEMIQIIGEIDPWNYRSQRDQILNKLDDLDILTHREVGKVFDPFDDNLTVDIKGALSTYLGGTIPTGWTMTDELLEGGFRRGELIMPAALPGDGKSMSCISFTGNVIRSAVEAAEQGHNVYYCILDNTDQEVLAKLWANFLRIPTRRLDSEPTAPAKMALLKDKYRLRGRITCRKWPRKSKSVNDIRKDILLQERRRGIRYSVIIVDYLDTVKPDGFHKEHRHGLDAATVGLAALAEELGVVVIAPTQLHRAAKFIETPDIDNLAEAFSKSWHAAVIFMILATRMERIQGNCRFWWPKTRRASEKFMVKMKRTNLYQEFTEDPEWEPYWIDENEEEVHEHAQKSKRKEREREKAQAAKPKTDPSIFEVGRMGVNPFEPAVA